MQGLVVAQGAGGEKSAGNGRAEGQCDTLSSPQGPAGSAGPPGYPGPRGVKVGHQRGLDCSALALGEQLGQEFSAWPKR